MHEYQDRKLTFGGIPELYDAVRPGYPTAVVDTILDRLDGVSRPRLLEIGCGSGQATALFAARGLRITACDISPALIDLARRRVGGHANVEFLAGKFEDLAFADASYDLIISAQAFHWVDPAIGLPKVARLLGPGGVVGLFWNFLRLDATPTLTDVRDLVLAAVPAFAEWGESSEERFEARTHWERPLDETPGLTDSRRQVFTSELLTNPGDFVGLLSTYSWFQTQTAEIRDRLMKDLQTRLAGTVTLEVPVRTALFTAVRWTD